jgi:di/tricarboxylate transporter
MRNGDTDLAPSPHTRLKEGDRLLVSGRLDRLEEFRQQRLPFELNGNLSVQDLAFENMCVLEVKLSQESRFLGQTLTQIGFRRMFGANVLAIMRDGSMKTSGFQDTPLTERDVLLVQVTQEQCDKLEQSPEMEVKSHSSTQIFHMHEQLFAVHIPDGSSLDGKNLIDGRLGDAYGLTVLGILRDNDTYLAPEPEDVLLSGDTLLVEGSLEALALLRSLQDLSVDEGEDVDVEALESEEVGLIEAILSPKTTLSGKTLRENLFREKFGLNVIAIWGDGRTIRSNLRDRPLKFGDVLLIHGPRDRLNILSRERDFIVLSPDIGEMPRSQKAPIAALIMAAVVISVLVGWLPIAIAAVIGASLMVLTGCLTMDEAYRNIEWRAVFLIAGMLPLGIAMEKSGAASFLASLVVNLVGDYGAIALIAGLFGLTALASQIMPNAVVTVLMAPIAINTALNAGISPYTLVMAVAISASASFLSPVAHPANLLVMGPGGYRFKDYLKLGIPLTILVLVLSLLVLPIIWPLAP